VGTGVNNRIKYLFTTEPEPDTPKCNGIFCGNKKVSAANTTKVTNVMMMHFFFMRLSSFLISY
jgi:hypothetical protein